MTEIANRLDDAGIPTNLSSNGTKLWYLKETLEAWQAVTRDARYILHFIESVMNPINFDGFDAESVKKQEFLFDRLNSALALCGYELKPDGKIEVTTPAFTLEDAMQRASRLREKLVRRDIHEDVLQACRSELLADNYFHAVFEATKSVALKIRQMSGLTSDGTHLVEQAFGGREPRLLINNLSNDSEISEHEGFIHLLKSMFGMFRNPIAHEVRDHWPIEEQDAIDLMTLASLFHRRLDQSHQNINHKVNPKARVQQSHQ